MMTMLMTMMLMMMIIIIIISISVGIATNYWLVGPGSNPGGDENLRPSRPALEPTQPPVK